MVPGPLKPPPGWKPGSKAVHGPASVRYAPWISLDQLAETFFDWQAIGDGHPRPVHGRACPNTLILAVASGVIGWCSAWCWPSWGSPGTPVLRWPARIYTDIFRGLPAVVIILLIGSASARWSGN